MTRGSRRRKSISLEVQVVSVRYMILGSGSGSAVESLRKKNISKAAAWQRTGRAGREVRLQAQNDHSLTAQRAGECFRLFTSKVFDEEMADFDAPEIQRVNLASAVLQLVAMGQNPLEFEYIDPPGRDNSEHRATTGHYSS